MLTSAINADGTGEVEIDYDNEGRAVEERWIVDGNTYTSNAALAPGGELLFRAYPDGDSVGTALNPATYDGFGRMLSVPGIITSMSYDASGQTDTVSYANGTSSAFTYNPERLFLDKVETFGPGVVPPLFSFTYGRDDVGRISTITSSVSGESWIYTYDDIDQRPASSMIDRRFLAIPNRQFGASASRTVPPKSPTETFCQFAVILADQSGSQ